MIPYFIEVNEDLQQVIQILDDKIYEHNSSKIERDGSVLFSRIVRDETKQVVAGIAGWAWASACEITHLWVDERVRKVALEKCCWKQLKARPEVKDARLFL